MKKLFFVAAIGVLISSNAYAETYRLVHAIGNTERVNGKGMTKTECETRKKELKTIVAAMGVGGSVTCLPDSMFND